MIVLLLFIIIILSSLSLTTSQFIPFQHLLGHSQSFATLWSAPHSIALAFVQTYDPSLCLAPQNLTAPGTHPVVIMANWMTHLHTTPIQIAYFSSDYNEVLAAVPFTSLCAKPNAPIVTSVPILWLDSIMAVIGGRWFYGLPKYYASVVAKNPVAMDRLAMFDNGKQIVSMSSAVNFSAPMSFSVALKHSPMLHVLQLLNTQTIFDHGTELSDPHICSSIVFDYANGTFYMPESLEMSFADNALPGVPAFNVSSDSSPTIVLSASWTMPNPLNYC
jgi:hypothetical protein